MNKEPARNFQDLVVGQKAHQFVLSAYRFSGNFPSTETYGLTSPFRRAAVSIPANIAEGFKRNTLPDQVRMLNIAQGSLEECRYYRILAQDLGYGDSTLLTLDLEEVSKLLESYSNASRQKINSRLPTPVRAGLETRPYDRLPIARNF